MSKNLMLKQRCCNAGTLFTSLQVFAWLHVLVILYIIYLPTLRVFQYTLRLILLRLF